jgi:hypothetical protein
VTDRLIAFTVLLDREIRDDDAQPIVDAIRQLRGVADVVPVVADPHNFWAKETARQELLKQVFALLQRPVQA